MEPGQEEKGGIGESEQEGVSASMPHLEFHTSSLSQKKKATGNDSGKVVQLNKRQ